MSTRHPDPSSSPATPPVGGPVATKPRNDRPLPRGERRAWNAATTLVGGVAAIGLLVGGAGVSGALALTQERSGSWDAPSAVTNVHVDADSAAVYVRTSATADHVQVQWYQAGINIPDHELTPSLRDGTLSVDVAPSAGIWGSGSTSQQVTVVVPQDDPPVSVDIQGTTNTLSLEGSFKDVVAKTDGGAVDATNVEASVLDASAGLGQVLMDGVHVSNRLDAHVEGGLVLVDTQGTSPKRASVTASYGSYGVAMPAADYWYPQGSQQDFSDPHHPVTSDPVGPDPDEDSYEYEGSYEPSLYPDATQSASAGPTVSSSPSPSASSARRSSSATTGSGTSSADDAAGRYDADSVCSTVPEDRPCLYLKGMPMSVKNSGWMYAWHDGWRTPGTVQDSDGQPDTTPAPSGSATPARED